MPRIPSTCVLAQMVVSLFFFGCCTPASSEQTELIPCTPTSLVDVCPPGHSCDTSTQTCRVTGSSCVPDATYVVNPEICDPNVVRCCSTGSPDDCCAIGLERCSSSSVCLDAGAESGLPQCVNDADCLNSEGVSYLSCRNDKEPGDPENYKCVAI